MQKYREKPFSDKTTFCYLHIKKKKKSRVSYYMHQRRTLMPFLNRKLNTL